MAGRKVAAGLAGSALGLWAYDTFAKHERFNRSCRTVFAAVKTLYQYKVVLDRHPEKLYDVHDAVAQIWFDTCSLNGGLYIKLGQGIATMNHVLPSQYIRLFSNLWDKAPSVSFEEVRNVIETDFGRKLEELFSEFNHEPIASASIAQVHKAKLLDGTPVAVKVQKPAIQDQMGWDLALYKALVFIFDRVFELPLYWTVDHTCRHLEMESNFYLEALNTVQAKTDLEPYVKNVYVPKVYPDFLTRRIMTMEWIDGIKISEPAEVTAAGFDVTGVVYKMVEAFSHQIFVSGFVHADPHPGNVLVRRRNGQTEIVVLDHGLCVRERESFRLQYCQLWRAMLLMDVETIKSICASWGIQDFELFASIQLFRPFRKNMQVVHVEKFSPKELMQKQVETKERFRQMMQNTALIPEELLLIGRSMNIMRANNKRMGSVVNRISIMAEKAAEGFRFNPSQTLIAGNYGGIRSMWDRSFFRFNLWFITTMYNVSKTWNYLMEKLFGMQKLSLEEILEQNTAQVMKEKLGEVG